MDIERFVSKRNELLTAIKDGAFLQADIGPGESVYHYTSIAGLKGILESQVFYATEYHFLNDEDEFSYIDELIIEVLKEDFSTYPIYENFGLALCEHYIACRAKTEELEKSYYVVSFSKKADNLTLWAEFANTGCSMELLPFEMMKDTSFCFYGCVKYSRNEQKQELREAIRTVLEHYTEKQLDVSAPVVNYFSDMDEQEIRLITEPIVQLLMFYGMAMKRTGFASEEEFRFVFSSEGKEIKFRQKDSLLLPYIEIPIELNNADFKSVCLAPLNKGEKNRRSLNKFLQNKGYTGCKVKESEMTLKY